MMSNVLTDVGHDVKVAAVDAVHGVVKVVDFLPHAISVLGTAIKDQPEIKQAVIDLVKQAGLVIGDLSMLQSKGINLIADTKTLTDAESFFGYFKNEFIPVVEKAFKELAADVQ